MLRNFSLQQAEHIARQRAPETAVALQPTLKRYFGIGNSTGLGMAPYLINHPQLISRWVEMRELALARVRGETQITEERLARLSTLIARGVRHLAETVTEDTWQTQNNQTVREDLCRLQDWLATERLQSWEQLLSWSAKSLSLQAEELLNCILLELYPDLVDELEDRLSLVESLELQPEMAIIELRTLIERHYAWALAIDFDATVPLKRSGTAPKRNRNLVWVTATWKAAGKSRCHWALAIWFSSVIACLMRKSTSIPLCALPAFFCFTPSSEEL